MKVLVKDDGEDKGYCSRNGVVVGSNDGKKVIVLKKITVMVEMADPESCSNIRIPIKYK